MKELVDCGCNGACNADIDFSDDNGYRYVLEELKATRAHIDEIINVIEMRMKKDAIIDKVMATGEDALFIEENINEAVYEVEKNAFSCGFALCLELISGRLMGGMVNE